MSMERNSWEVSLEVTVSVPSYIAVGGTESMAMT